MYFTVARAYLRYCLLSTARAMSSYTCLELWNLPPVVQATVAPHPDLWAFLTDATTTQENATLMAQFLAEAVAAASSRPDVQVVICEALVQPGLKSSTWLTSNHKPLADAMAALFQQLQPYARGRGRTALGVARFGGGAMCRKLLAEHCDPQERCWRVQYVITNLKDWAECDALLCFK